MQFSSTRLELAIGLACIFVALNLLVSWLYEALAGAGAGWFAGARRDAVAFGAAIASGPLTVAISAAATLSSDVL
jgi:hypothetical protein